jgi:hypothetical protein
MCLSHLWAIYFYSWVPSREIDFNKFIVLYNNYLILSEFYQILFDA